MNKLPNNYFPHDFNARYDRKILRLRKVLGIEGYGIYWMLIETLALQENFSYPLKDIDLLADDFGSSVEKVEAVVRQFELFQIDSDAKFFSLSLIARMQKYLDLSEKARRNINIRWEKARKLKELQQVDTTVLLPYNDRNTIKEKNIKEYKIKEDNIRENNKIDFDIFWNLYDKKVGSKEKLIKKWNKFSLETQNQILEHIKVYKESQPDKQYRKNPETYFNNESWKDEVINAKSKSNGNFEIGGDGSKPKRNITIFNG